MDTNDKELFDAAMSDEPIEQVEAEAPEPVQEVEGQPRDDQGRFAPKAEQVAEPVAVAETAPQDEGRVPSWRLREERERAEAAENRARQVEANFQRQMQELQSRLPPPAPTPAPDVFEDPNKFLEHGVRQAVDPIRSEIGQLREFYSKREAVREHGQEKVNAAYKAVADGMQSRDPEVAALYQRAMQSMDPFGEIVAWHQQKTVHAKIGNDPEAWLSKEVDRRLAEDPQFASTMLQKIQSQVRGAPQSTNTIKLPPSIGKVPSSHSASDDVGDMSDAGLFAHAMR